MVWNKHKHSDNYKYIWLCIYKYIYYVQNNNIIIYILLTSNILTNWEKIIAFAPGFVSFIRCNSYIYKCKQYTIYIRTYILVSYKLKASNNNLILIKILYLYLHQRFYFSTRWNAYDGFYWFIHIIVVILISIFTNSMQYTVNYAILTIYYRLR